MPMRAILGLLMMLGACAPIIVAPGIPSAPARLEADAIIATDLRKLPVTRYVPNGSPKVVIIALHGFNDYARHFDLAGPFWANRGILTLAYDQRGFGRGADAGLWADSAAMISDAQQAVALARIHYPQARIVLLGVSMGGAVAASAAQRGVDADALVLVSPALWGWRVMNPFYQTTLWLTAHLAPDWTLTGRSLGRKPSDNIDFLRRMGRDPFVIKQTRVDAVYGLTGLMDQALAAPETIRLPTLILFGDDDQIVPESPARDLAARITAPCRFEYINGGYHMLLVDLAAEKVWTSIADFALEPNGAEFRGCK
jgi:alpha-beta hydrolase superfamily lysophospholipase